MAARRGPSYASFANVSNSLTQLGTTLDGLLVSASNLPVQLATSFSSPGVTTTTGGYGGATGGYYYKLLTDLLSGLF